MTANAIWFDAVTGAPSYTGNVLRLSLGALVGGKSTTRPLGGHSGVVRGTPASTVYMSSTHPHVAVHQGFHDLETAGTAGGYLWYNDADVDLGALAAADATNPRISSVWVRIDDPSQDGTSVPLVAFGITDGTPGATSTTRGAAGGPPTLPNSRCLELAQITVPNTGGGGTASATVAWVAPYCSAAGGVILCLNSSQYPASPTEGDEVYDLALHCKLRYSGSAWVKSPTVADLGYLATANVISGSAPSATTPPRIQSGTVTVTTNSTAIGTFSWPTAFPNGLVSVSLTSMTDGAPNVRLVDSPGTTTTQCQFVARVPAGTGYNSQSIKVAYTAFGW